MDLDPIIGRTLGSFRVESKIGEGGMGAVYRAVHTRLEREAAFKVLPAHLMRSSGDLVERFFIEARAAAKLDHPNVVKVYDADEVEGIHYIAMEYVRGPDVKELLRDRGPLNSMEALEIALQAALGLSAASRERIIHRDIKPANLMLTQDGVVKVADFGLARNVDAASHPTQSGQVVGTPAYMSPEQADGKKADFRSDIYALGVTLFEMVTGSVPFWAETSLAILRAHVEAPIPDPRSFNTGVSPGLTALVKRMMAKKREERFDSYDGLVEEISALKKALTTGPAAGPVDSDSPTLTLSRLLAPPATRSPESPGGAEEEAEEPSADRTPATRHPLEGLSITKVTHHAPPGVHPAVWVVGTVVVMAAVMAVVLASVLGGREPDEGGEGPAIGGVDRAGTSGPGGSAADRNGAATEKTPQIAPGDRDRRKKKFDSFVEVARSLSDTLPEEALKNWNHALQYADDDGDREAARKAIAALADEIRERKGLEKSDEARRRLDEALMGVREAVKGKRFREAEAFLDRAKALAPHDAELEQTIAELRYQASVAEGMHRETIKDWIGARTAYRRALNRFPGRGNLRNRLRSVEKRIADQSQRFGGAFMVPDASSDQYGNPVTTRKGGTYTDAAGGLPYEIWLLRPPIEFVLVPAGRFRMGTSHEEEPEHWKKEEKPDHDVTLAKPFFISKYEVTQVQWRAFMGRNPSENKGSHRPVDSVTWDECAEYCMRLTRSVREGLPGTVIGLPSEARWEFACRGGTATRFFTGEDEGDLKAHAWFILNAGGETHPVGGKKPNPLGLYDMIGNACEWCADPHRAHRGYEGAPADGSIWAAEEKNPVTRMVRGGHGGSPAMHCRSAYRSSGRRDDGNSWRGFRLVLDLETK
jgi:serine/threonine-protein kinase